ncbi:unnamed protein product [Schistosoma turkestanicum]|nr:unnamed protein product [Schistosoma turkestanicum]
MVFELSKDSNYASDDLVRLSNCALSLINVEPYIQSIHDITPAFVYDLAVVLFGNDILPCCDCIETGCVENFKAIVCKLSEEIGEDLDHIGPEDLMSGEPRALSDFLVLLAAFIAYCYESELLNLRNSTIESSLECCDHLTADSKLTPKTKGFSDFQLSTSPELPRHSVTCAPVFSTSFHQPDRSMEQSTPVKRTPASFLTRNPYPPIDHVSSLPQKSNLFTFQPDNVKASYPVASCLPNFLDVHTDASPPATPNAMNGYLEIIHSNLSDADVVPSLQNSLNMQQFVPSSPVGEEFKKLENSDSPIKRLSNKEFSGSRNSVISVESIALNDHQLSISSHEDKVHSNNINDRSFSSSVELIHKSISDRHESSSSGRGHSLTVTQTAPFQSNTSAHSSLLELHTFPDSPKTTQHNHHSNVSQKSLNNNKLTYNESINDSYDSIGTNSILAWNADNNITVNKRMNKTDQSHDRLLDDDSTSLLASSLSSDTDQVSNRIVVVSNHCPITSNDIFTEMNDFADMLEKRLNYLKSVYVRAHSEAEALTDLVQLITSKSLHIIKPLINNNSQLNDNNNNKNNTHTLNNNNSFNNRPENHLHLESLIIKAIDRIDQLLEKYTTPCPQIIIPNVPNSGMLNSPISVHPKSKTVNHKLTKKANFHPKTDYHSSKFNSLHDDHFSNVELKKLLNLKHECTGAPIAHVELPIAQTFGPRREGEA